MIHRNRTDFRTTLAILLATLVTLTLVACAPAEEPTETSEEMTTADDVADLETQVDVEQAGIQSWSCDRFNAVSDPALDTHDADAREAAEQWLWGYVSAEHQTNRLSEDTESLQYTLESVSSELAERCEENPELMLVEIADDLASTGEQSNGERMS